MMPSIGVQLFWMIAVGLTIGFAGHYIYPDRGLGMGGSIFAATLGAIVMGLAAYYLSYDLPGMYSFLGSLSFLFITNVFMQEA